jgi:AAA+ ATPase superfamily predicted ATPase
VDVVSDIGMLSIEQSGSTIGAADSFQLALSRDRDQPDWRNAAASSLAELVIARAGGEDTNFGDAIETLSRQKISCLTEAALVIQALGSDGLLDHPLLECDERFLVEVCERNHPEIAQYAGSADKRQTHEKIAHLAGAHERIVGLLSPLSEITSDVDGIVASRGQILAVLNNGVVKAYCGPVDAQQVRTRIDVAIKKIARLSKEAESFWDDLSDADHFLSDQRAYVEQSHSLLIQGFFSPFVAAASNAIEKIVSSTRGKAKTQIGVRTVVGGILQKRYPLHDVGREISLVIPLRSGGPGIAINLNVRADFDRTQLHIENGALPLGNVVPGDFAAVFIAKILSPGVMAEIMLTVTWDEAGHAESREAIFLIEVNAQSANVDWALLEYQHPYSTDVAKGDAFVGRTDQVKSLGNRMLRQPMEPFFVTGQKRIGKTSLALAAAEFAKAHSPSSIHIQYLLWGKIAYDDPRASMRELGERFSSFIKATLPRDISIPDLDFDGSLAPLTRLADLAYETRPDLKYVLILDEFDEIHPELYQQGNLAETFFANLRALTTCENLCLVLVGGENMPFIMDRQGQKLNKLIPFRLDYFSRDREWDDFITLVRKPTEDSIYWHEDAISEIFNLTNGNPYFAKIVCSSVFQNAVRERDADVTLQEVRNSLSSNIQTFDVNSFAHLWMDGIHKPPSEREPDILRRSRTLVALGRAARRGSTINLSSVLAGRDGIMLTDTEVSPVLNDFVKRGILRENNKSYDFILPIFRLWLTEIGINRLLADALGEELAAAVMQAEDAAYVTADEISALVKKWPTYQGRQIGTDDVRAWLEQVKTHQSQRLLFKILSNLHFYDELEIRERLRTLHGMVRPILPLFVQTKRSERRMDVLITYLDGEGKSGQYYASRYAEENSLSVRCLMSPSSFADDVAQHKERYGAPSVLLIVDDLVATGGSVSKKLKIFANENKALLQALEIPVMVLTMVATADGDAAVREAFSVLPWLSGDFRYCELLADSDFAFSESNRIWATPTEHDRAKALATDLGGHIYRDNPLGYGGMGILAVFPANCPNNSLPILHSKGRQGDRVIWHPLFPRLTN